VSQQVAGIGPDGGEDIMGLDDIADKAKQVADKAQDLAEDLRDKAGDALHSEQAEQISDAALDVAEKAANAVTGDKFADKVGDVREGIDDKIGTDGQPTGTASSE